MANVTDLESEIAVVAGSSSRLLHWWPHCGQGQGGGIPESDLDGVLAAIAALATRADEILA